MSELIQDVSAGYRRVVVDVTQEDIRHGVAMDCRGCPIALAMGRTFPSSVVKVFSTRVELWPFNFDADIIRVPLPQVAQDFIFAFDSPGTDPAFEDRYALAPFGFTVDVPELLLAIQGEKP